MAREEQEVRGLLVGEARSIVESQERIEQRVNVGLILAGVVIFAIVVGFSVTYRAATRLEPKLTESISTLNKATEDLKAATAQSKASMAGLRRQMEDFHTRFARLEAHLGLKPAFAERNYERKSVMSAATPGGISKDDTKKKGCLGLW